jgi:O-antigen/teichoic acid export membrane protein
MGNILRKLLSDSFIYAFLPRLSRLLSIAIMPLITRYLTPYDYGVTGILFAYVQIFEGFSNLGFDVVFINTFFKDKKNYRAIWQKLFGVLTLWAVPYGALLIPVTFIALPAEERSNFVSVLICVVFPIIVFDHTIDLGQKYLQMNKKALPFSLVSLIASVVVLISNYVTIVNFRMGYMGFFVSDFVGKGFSFLSYSFLIFIRLKLVPDFRFSYEWLKSQLAVAVPTIPHAYAAYILNTSDRLLLSFFKIPVPLIGLYSFAYSFGTQFSKIGQSMLVAGRPIMMEMFAQETREKDIQMRNLVWVLQAGLLAAGFLLSLWIKEIIQLLASNNELERAYVYAPLIIMSYTYYPIYFGAINKLYYFEKTKVFWKISFVAAVINLGLNIILIPLMGIWGAVLTTFLSYLYMGYSAYARSEFKAINSTNYREMYWLLLTCFLAISVFLIKDINIYVKATLTAISVFAWGMFWFAYRREILFKSLINKNVMLK